MNVIERDFVYRSVDELFHFRDLTDIHHGAAQSDTQRLRQEVKAIKEEENSFWWGGGDMIDAIGYHDTKRFDPAAFAPWITVRDLTNLAEVETTNLANELAPIADKCLGLAFGNHEDAVRLHHEQDVHNLLIQKLYAKKKQSEAIPSLGYSCLYVMRFHEGSVRDGHGADHSITVFLHHGYFANASLRQLKDVFIFFDCDWALFGHGHVLGDFAAPCMSVVKRDGKLTYDDRKIRIAISNGGFLRTLALPDEQAFYTEKRGCKPSILGPVPITYCPGKRKVSYTISP